MSVNTNSGETGRVDEIVVSRSSKRAGGVWLFFDRVRDVTDLNPAEEQQEAWEATIGDDDEVVGMAVVDTIPSSHSFISRIAVVEDNRRSGVATALIKAIHDEHGDVACRVRTNNTAGQGLVETLGFEQVDCRFHSLHRYELHDEETDD